MGLPKFSYLYRMAISEELIHFIWRFRLFDQFGLKSYADEHVEILDPGMPNRDAGPDFHLAKVKVGETVWVGHVEIHTEAKQWEAHGHQHDPAYDNVVLHVIWDGYCPVFRQDDTEIPTVLLSNYVDSNLLWHYDELMKSLDWIPCEHRLAELPELQGVQLMSRMLIDRLERKYGYVYSLLEETKHDWERVTAVLLCRAFGMRVNKEAFTELGMRFPLGLIEKYKGDALKVEALLFGQAGLLPAQYSDDYPRALKNEYAYLRQLHHLQPMEAISWKFMRMRPVNFPTVRIGQLAALFRVFPRLFSTILETDDMQVFQQKLLDALPNAYWNDHYHFGKPCADRKNHLPESFVQHLIINGPVLVLYAYGKYMGQQRWIDKAMDWLEGIPAEQNQIIRRFWVLGLHPKNAGDTQGLLYLKTDYCDNKRCLDCQAGQFLLKSSRGNP